MPVAKTSDVVWSARWAMSAKGSRPTVSGIHNAEYPSASTRAANSAAAEIGMASVNDHTPGERSRSRRPNSIARDCRQSPQTRRRLSSISNHDSIAPRTSTSACEPCREIDGIDTPLAYRDDIVTVFPTRHVPVGPRRRRALGHIADIPTLYEIDDTIAATLLCRVRRHRHRGAATFAATGTTIRQNSGVPGQRSRTCTFTSPRASPATTTGMHRRDSSPTTNAPEVLVDRFAPTSRAVATLSLSRSRRRPANR